MPEYIVTMDSGTVYRVEAPNRDAARAKVIALIRKRLGGGELETKSPMHRVAGVESALRIDKKTGATIYDKG